MADLDRMADSIKMEVLSEMAGTYFGARVALDDEFVEFDRLTDKLGRLGRSVVAQAGLLHALLLGAQGAPGFYAVLGVDPADVSIPLDKGPAASARLPFAFTPRGRWLKLVRRSYTSLQQRSEEYLHGRAVPDPNEPRRKIMTPSFTRLAAMAQDINHRVEHVNQNLPLSTALSYAKSLNGAASERENLMGASAGVQRDTQDYIPIEFASLALPRLPDLPHPDVAWSRVKPWLKRFWREHHTELARLLTAIQKGSPLRPPIDLSEGPEPVNGQADSRARLRAAQRARK